ncbi:MAG: hypothetical protein HQ464_04415 [Planctomycetes bacterium]|nr:hypothetical protein [Planctomycetota bacterium]
MSDSTRAASGNELLRDFRGGGLMRLLVLTVIVHVVLILATSVPYLRAAFGGGKADLTEQERLDAAVKEATASLQEIAKEHGVKPQDLGSRFISGGKAPAVAKPGGAQKAGEPTKPEPPTKPDAVPAAGGTPPKPNGWGAAGQTPASQQASGAPKTDAAAPLPPGPALPEVKDDVDLFK